MAEYIEREAAIASISTAMSNVDRSIMRDRLMSIPAADVVPVGAYNQAAWERDTAIEQLKQIGKSFGEQMDDVRPVVRGKWVKARGSWCTPGGDPVWECSECGKGRHVYGIEHGSYGAGVADGQWVACPNCGADMREGE